MHCSGCGECCHETEMELSSDDVERLVYAGYRPEDFMVVRDDVPRLRNVDSWCYFYSPTEKRCRVYKIRPLGCRLYTVIYVDGEGVALDKLCPMRHTVSKEEFKRKARILKRLLEKIYGERVSR
ncbi:MAG: YkgJ family cysteine cluster protein [Candidatus Bathyarchaeia archaeon]